VTSALSFSSFPLVDWRKTQLVTMALSLSPELSALDHFTQQKERSRKKLEVVDSFSPVR